MSVQSVESHVPGKLSREKAIDYFRAEFVPTMMREQWQRFVAALIRERLVDEAEAREWKAPV